VRSLAVAVTAIAAIALAGCGSSASGSSPYGGGQPAPTPSGANGPATIRTATTSLGTILVDSGGRTLYLWEGDHGSRSACNGGCAAAWPPVTTSGRPKASGSGRAALLGTTKRDDGTLEVTYAGHPLYRFAGDSADGQTNGEGSDEFGATWWTVTPGGKAVTR
jgi:predicted lipoprotein with Yx(FWY)xxD motif